MADLRKQVGARIRHWRQLRRYSQEELGERAGLSYKFIGEVERGSGNPTLDTLSAIASALDVEVADLVSIEPAPRTARRLSPNDYQTVREALDSIDTVLKRFRPPRSGRTSTS